MPSLKKGVGVVIALIMTRICFDDMEQNDFDPRLRRKLVGEVDRG